MNVKAAEADWEPEFVGQTAGFLEVEIRSRVGGILEKRIFEEGQFVKQGAQLFQIDPVPYKIALERARGVLAQAEAQVERTRREHVRTAALFKEDAVSEKEQDEAEMAFKAATADLQVARANLHDAEVKLAYTRVDAPIAGIVRKESCSVGTLVTTTAEASLLTTMVQVDPLYVNFSLPGSDYAMLRQLQQKGILSRPEGKQEVTIVYPDGKLHPEPGSIIFTDSTEDPKTATVRSKVELPNPAAGLMPGQFVRVRLKGLKLKNVVLIPRQAIFTTQQGASVYVVDKDMKAQMRQVTEQLAIGRQSVISSGLADGERIITAGIMKVQPDAMVREANPEAQQAPAAAAK
ncbi:MAG: efflux RND transporter periplasmic adaptor subunit [Deltaproteobacteria bacterium]|nr:efflux RND transporter periplasmic adaptor subunit [Deltaproteobacteria bacterium]